jgi:hypothetical protein
VVVQGRVRRALLAGCQGAAEEHGVHLVGAGGGALVVGQDDERAVGVEVGVGEQGRDPVAGPAGSEGKTGVMAVVVYGEGVPSVKHVLQPTGAATRRTRTHVGRNEHPLWEGVAAELAVEESEVLGLGETAGIVGDGSVGHDGATE